MPKDLRGVVRWQDLTSEELAARDRGSDVAILTLGAIEQHGGHLPLSTDLDIGEGLLEATVQRLPETFPLLVLPSMAIGASDEHTGFTGTLSLPPEVAIAVIEAYGDSVARAGIRRLVLFNSHGGNKAIADLAALKLRERWGMLVVKANYTRFTPLPDALPAEELRHGLHGGALETALMLHLAPGKIRTEALSHPPSKGELLATQGMMLGPEGEAPFAWLAEDLHPGGVVGNARLASAELGRRLADHYAAKLALVIEEAQALDIADFHSRSGLA